MVCCSTNSSGGVESHVAAWEKKDAHAKADQPIQEKSSEVEKKSEQLPKVVWTIGPPIWEEDTWEPPKYLKGKHFFEVCAMCKKNIDPKNDVFMYGYLQAFCSDDCREDRIAFDRAFGPPSPQSKGANDKSVVQPAVDKTKAPTLNRSKRLHALEE
ncbi:hypothetical protein ACH5RR_033248 [Cinchona calisaya]|uniref:FLZ-type domain-containing protein n=1 Tax=Cinchona calisaya TaxID=153742 RepID=A0ABD2YMH4_9GENT